MASAYGTPAFNDKHKVNRARRTNARGPASDKMWETKLWPFLDKIQAGHTVNEAAASVGVEYRTPYKWEERYEKFRTEWKRIRAKRGHDDRPELPFDAHFRQHYLHYPTPPHMQKMIDLINGLGSGEWGGIWVPPGHAKSAVVEDMVNHHLAMNPNLRIFYISKTQARAIKSVGLLQERMTNRGQFSEYIEDYGPFKVEGRTWTQTHFTVARKTADHREYSVEGLGIGGQLTGSRADIIILDDIADVDNQSAADIEKQYEWIYKVAQTRLVDGGKVVVIGTRMKEEDIYSKMIDEDFFDQTLTMPCLLREPGTDGEDDPGEWLWPDGPVSPDRLLRIRARDARMWELIYQQNPLPTVGAIFPYDAIEACFDETRYVSHVPSGTRVVVGIDPAVTGYTAGVVLAVNVKTGRRYLVDVWNQEHLTDDGGDHHAGLVQFTVELCKKYNAEVCCFENNSTFEVIYRSWGLRKGLSDINCRLIPGRTQGAGEATDRAVAQLSSLFTNGIISIPTAGNSKSLVKPFVDQFVRWRPNDKKLVRDIVKATEMAQKAAEHIETPIKRIASNTRKLPPYLQKQRFVRQVV